MSFNPENQHRATIIRGRAKTDMDNLLPIYANILESICSCSKDDFPARFNKRLENVLSVSTKKTLDNHRTEIAHKLFGMYYEDREGIVQISEKTLKLLKDNDQPAFFKDICNKFQFPNGMKKIHKIKEDIEAELNIRQCAYILELLRLAKEKSTAFTKDEIGYYVLNALDVLQGKVSPEEVLQTILDRRKTNIVKKVQVNGKASSFATQHIRETLNYLELANLITVHDQEIFLNTKESNAISKMASFWNKPLPFDLLKYDLNSPDGIHDMYLDWDEYYSRLSEPVPGIFDTPATTLTGREAESIFGFTPKSGDPPLDIGKEGEAYVYKYEREKVEAFNPKLKNKVLNLSNIKGLGFDVQSVWAEPGPKAEHKIFIEVKSTKRVTVPSKDLNDTVTLTRSEWVAAEQYGIDYRIFRVYFTPKKIVILSIEDPFSKSEEGLVNVTPKIYEVTFTEKSGEFMQ